MTRIALAERLRAIVVAATVDGAGSRRVFAVLGAGLVARRTEPVVVAGALADVVARAVAVARVGATAGTFEQTVVAIRALVALASWGLCANLTNQKYK